MHIVLTGVTGVIGREVLTELLLLQNHKISSIICPVRSKNNRSALERMEIIIKRISKENDLPMHDLYNLIQVIDTSSETGKNYNSVARFLNDEGIDKVHVIHLASTTNLSTKPKTEEQIIRDSYEPSIDLFSVMKEKLVQYSFVSTAFSCGHQSGKIPSDYSKLKKVNRRNYYEVYKSMTEKELKMLCQENDVIFQIFRPGIVCGRLLRKPYYYTPKFNVFYAWTSFFAAMKEKGLDVNGCRIVANEEAGINITSSDYVAKAIVRGFLSQQELELNLVHSENFNVKNLVNTLLQSIEVKQYQLTKSFPNQGLSTVENLYYQTAGNQFSSYLNTSIHSFDVNQLRKLMRDVPEPDVQGHFSQLVRYAIERNFIPEG